MLLHQSKSGLTGRIHTGLIAAMAVVLGCGILGLTGLAFLPHGETITRGVSVNGVQLGGMSKSEAMVSVEKSLESTVNTHITLAAGGKNHDTSVKALGIRPDVASTVRAAYAIGREKSFFARTMHSLHARWGGEHLTPTYSMNDSDAKTVLKDFAQQINRLPEDATARWDGSQVVIHGGHNGAKLDEPASLKMVKAQVLGNLSKHKALPTKLDLPYREKFPRVTAEKLQPVDSILGSFSTSYGSSSRSRANNVDTAARAIDRVIVMPDEVFSFNDTVGPRDVGSGFTTAPVIVNGQLQPGIGGGVCQVSTTLYNAVLLAGLDIVQRSHHSIPSHYVAPGLDATVSYGSLDFRFKNSTDAPIIIESLPHGRRLLVRILGKGPAPKVKMVRSGIKALPGRTITKSDPTIPRGTRVVEQKGSGGIAVTVTRIIETDSGEKREVLSHDRYPGEPTIIRVGTGAPKPTTTPAAPVTVEQTATTVE